MKHLQHHLMALTRDPIYADFAYVTYEDLQALNKSTNDEDESEQAILAIRAPPGSTFEVPNFSDDQKQAELAGLVNYLNERYQLFINANPGQQMQ